MKSGIYVLGVLMSLSVLLMQCDIPTGLASWEPEILAPLASNVSNAKELSDVQDREFAYNMPPSDLGFPTGETVSVPPINIAMIGPTTFNVSDFHESIVVETAQFDISISNFFPIPLSQGTRLTFRNSDDENDPSNIILEHIVPQDIQPNQIYTFTTNITDQEVNSSIYFYLEQFSSPGGNDVVFDPDGIEMSFGLSFLELSMVKIKTNQEIELTQNVALSLVSDEGGPDDELANGQLDVFVSNELPLNINFQLYFYGADDITIIDSLFPGVVNIEGGTTEAATGAALDPAATEVTVLLDAVKMQHLKESSKMKVYFGVNTNGYSGTSVSANRDLNFEFKIVGDLKLNVNL